jgi:hypothetical protein
VEAADQMITFDEAVPRIMAAERFSDLGTGGSDAVHAYRKWVKLVHPDTVSAARRATATQAFARLSALYHERGDAHRPTGTLRTRNGVYRIEDTFASGDIAELLDTGDTLLKIPRDPADNDLMRAEADALLKLRTNGDARFRAYAPRLIETFTHEDHDHRRRTVNVIRRQRGMRRLSTTETLEDGVWIWRRLLTALGWAHRAGVIHGAILEPHVLIHPEHRGLVLVDWCYSGHRPRAIVKAREVAYPPEVLNDRTATPATDIYMATGLMTRLLGPRMPQRLKQFAAGCIYQAPRMRPQDAWALLAELDEIIRI